MVLSSAERQRRYIARIRAAAAASDTFRDALTKALEANTRLRRDLAAAKRLLAQARTGFHRGAARPPRIYRASQATRGEDHRGGTEGDRGVIGAIHRWVAAARSALFELRSRHVGVMEP
jgi:hypothetical protein